MTVIVLNVVLVVSNTWLALYNLNAGHAELAACNAAVAAAVAAGVLRD